MKVPERSGSSARFSMKTRFYSVGDGQMRRDPIFQGGKLWAYVPGKREFGERCPAAFGPCWSNAPFARPDLAGLAKGLKFVRDNDYPIRGQLAA
ncbi:hypothetical protein VSX64_21770 [Aurantimonas sp. C2-6-R+9]|uniref:hypothetical protein n=1 Tax=unclassified Aurantimonas TaxID=2638230 RepID=UPI002E1860AA|nr:MULTISPECIES: hypothetical protein [unclassified Aurantimonas]MEC5293261.1 hypothetical protein [Aurantimonas sp. C2-3-R2]MEC5383423.1 hypothetical protein [Aurantimonas sp. C2-6-R+9]MEC5414355.1 hypothetical protein [Aurantimonas sp. C2-4-R8]